MEILAVPSSVKAKKEWNSFIKNNYPPVGVFMQSWEWGDFQTKLGRETKRFFVMENQHPIAAFTLTLHELPFGMKYGYLPRGPVFLKTLATNSQRIGKIFVAIKSWAKKEMPSLVFLRFEPPLESSFMSPVSETPSDLLGHLRQEGFEFPNYYVQPRKNHVIALNKEKTMLDAFHPSTRSNINRAIKRGVTVDLKAGISDLEYERFSKMMAETNDRNDGKSVYPTDEYFKAFLESIPKYGHDANKNTLELAIFYGYHDGEPAAANLVLLFGKTATYIYGAAYTEKLNSKITTYLHWAAMQHAAEQGFKYYDIGGVDEALWPSLTVFKRQFRGQEFDYIGNIDLPINKPAYMIYNLAKKVKKST